MNRDNFVRNRKVAERMGLTTSLKRGTGGINDCFRPSAEASKADLAEFHAEDMKLRRTHQRKRLRNVGFPPTKRNDNPEWRNREFTR